MIWAYRDNVYNIVLASRQVGKGLPLDTLIPTPTGYTTMGEVKVGDTLLGSNGKIVNVTGISPVKTIPCYNVSFNTGEQIITDEEHLWEVQDKNGKYKVISSQELSEQKLIISKTKKEARYSVKATQKIEYAEKELPIDPYLFGYWLGDGRRDSFSITVDEKDLDNLLPYLSQYQYSVKPDTRNPKVKAVYVKGMMHHLRNLGVYDNKNIPLIFKRASIEQRISLLQGLLDSDGYCSDRNGVIEITLKDKILIDDVHELVSSLGVVCNIPRIKYNKKYDKNYYKLSFSVFKDNFNAFRLPRKLDRQKQTPSFNRRNSTHKRHIISVDRIESVPTKCIAVDSDDRLYLITKSYIPTHNTETSCAYMLWFSIFHESKTILVVSNKSGGAKEIIAKIQLAYEELPEWLKPGIQENSWNKHECAFNNKSRILATTTAPDSGRGMAISLLYADELAFVKPHIATTFWESIQPTLSTGGSCIISSTPNGDINLFAQLWRGAELGTNSFHPVFIKWDRVPGRDESYKQKQIALLGERRWRQEFECEFLSSDNTLFDNLDITQMEILYKDVLPLYKVDDFDFYKKIYPDMTYVIGIDPSSGSGDDFTVVEVFEFPSLEQVCEYRTNTMIPSAIYPKIRKLINIISRITPNVYFSIENNGVGQGIIALYEADETPPLGTMMSEEKKTGFVTTAKSKIRAFIKFKELFEKRIIKIFSKIFLKEMKSFVRKDGSYDHQTGASSDCISAFLIVLRVIEELAQYDENAYTLMYSYVPDAMIDEPEDWKPTDDDEYSIPMPVVV